MIFNSSSSEEEIRSITFDIVRKETTNQSATLRLTREKNFCWFAQRFAGSFVSFCFRINTGSGELPNRGKTGS